jgi:hypothetical protein
MYYSQQPLDREISEDKNQVLFVFSAKCKGKSVRRRICELKKIFKKDKLTHENIICI